MSEPVARVGDLCTGHPLPPVPLTDPPRPALGGSPNIFANGKPVVRVGDLWALHGAPGAVPHPGTTAGGSSRVFANGRPLARVGDPISCGSRVAQGSPNIFCGG